MWIRWKACTPLYFKQYDLASNVAKFAAMATAAWLRVETLIDPDTDPE
jgi:hypothetical protein